MNENNIISFATSIGSKEPKDFILFKWKESSICAVLDFIKMYFENCGYGMCDIQINDTETSVSVHHDFGKRIEYFYSF